MIGELTDTNRMQVSHEGREIADMPLKPLADGAPEYDRPHVKTPPAPASSDITHKVPVDAALKQLMNSSEIASRRWIWEQYDSMVMGDTISGPGGDAALVRVHGSRKALAISTDVTPRYCLADPVTGGCAGGCRDMAQHYRHWRKTACDYQLLEFRKSGKAGNYGSICRLLGRHGRGL